MDNNEIYLELGKLISKVDSQGQELHAVRIQVDALVNANALARGGKRMLYQVGALCSTLGAGLATIAGYALSHLK